MTEFNLFCFSEKYNDENSFQQNRYRAFNRQLTKERYTIVVEEVRNILSVNKENSLDKFWKSVTDEQWKKLLAIPEASDFKDGFEYISGQKINLDMVEVIANGKTFYISKESAAALGLEG